MCTGRLASRRSGPAARRLRKRAGGIRGSESSHLPFKIYITAASSAVFHGRAQRRPDAGRHAASDAREDRRSRTGCRVRNSPGDEWYTKLRALVRRGACAAVCSRVQRHRAHRRSWTLSRADTTTIEESFQLTEVIRRLIPVLPWYFEKGRGLSLREEQHVALQPDLRTHVNRNRGLRRTLVRQSRS
jgi:hypothetical protein